MERSYARTLSLKISQAFGGRMSRMGKTCGAVTGALMVIGLKYGRVEVEDEESKEKTYEKAREFVARFVERNGTINCTELIGVDLGTPEGRKIAKERGIIREKCTKYVADAVEIVEDLVEP